MYGIFEIFAFWQNGGHFSIIFGYFFNFGKKIHKKGVYLAPHPSQFYKGHLLMKIISHNPPSVRANTRLTCTIEKR